MITAEVSCCGLYLASNQAGFAYSVATDVEFAGFVRASNEAANEDAKPAVVFVGSLTTVFFGGRCLQDGSQSDLRTLPLCVLP